jgi:predicted DNA-binding protein (UPF0251 family)
LEFCSLFEVAAHLDVQPEGVRQLARVEFQDGCDTSDFDGLGFITVEEHIKSKEGSPETIVVMNSHPIVTSAVPFADIAVMPPYSIGEEGMTITLRGVPKGISGFLAATRIILPPDKVSVISPEEPKHEARALLGERQMEILKLAIHHGYYQDPRAISMSDLSKKLGIARSTLGEHLDSAEAALVKWVLEED